MTLVYILLSIIAVGVLLLSQEGKALLKSAWGVAIGAGVCVLAFFLVIFGIEFFQSNTFKWLYQDVLPWIILPLLGLYWIYVLVTNFDKWIAHIKTTWVERRGYSIWVIVLLVVIVTFWVIIPLWLSN